MTLYESCKPFETIQYLESFTWTYSGVGYMVKYRFLFPQSELEMLRYLGVHSYLDYIVSLN